MSDETTPRELTSTTGERFTPGTPDTSGTTLAISEAARRMGVSVSTLRRRLTRGQIPGAHKAPGPDGLEWRVPVSALPDPTTPHTHVDEDEVETLRAELAELRTRVAVAEALDEARRAEVESLRTMLVAALDKVPKALEAGEVNTPRRRRWGRKAEKPGA